MTRQLDEHITNPANDQLKITTIDSPGPGGANHHYRVEGFDGTTNPAKSPSVSHLIVGDEDWEPTVEEMLSLSNMLMEAQLDPDGAVFTTRKGVEVKNLDLSTRTSVDLIFQNGAINEVGVNGITHEALIAIVLDRLRAFNAGDFRCKENACAITHLEEALMWLQQRTLKKMRRGVEGTLTV